MSTAKEKILVIRFSSFGDILATMSVTSALRQKFPSAEIHWLTRSDFAEMAFQVNGGIKISSLDRGQGFHGLWRILKLLRRQRFTHIYDAHNNLRSHIICWGLRGPLGLFRPTVKFLRRSQYRWRRLMLFRFRVNLYPKPFVHQWALLEPLQKWGVSTQLPVVPVFKIPVEDTQAAMKIIESLRRRNKPIIAISPSASYELKRWPVAHWQELIRKNPEWSFLALGGPQDQFIETITQVAPERTINCAGKFSYLQSAALVASADVLISNDTGLMHVAEQLGKKCVALLGPAPFGYPGRPDTKILEKELACRPCSKHGQGPCINSFHQKCMVDISVDEVSLTTRQILDGPSR